MDHSNLTFVGQDFCCNGHDFKRHAKITIIEKKGEKDINIKLVFEKQEDKLIKKNKRQTM